jgi:hypothetical protein
MQLLQFYYSPSGRIDGHTFVGRPELVPLREVTNRPCHLPNRKSGARIQEGMMSVGIAYLERGTTGGWSVGTTSERGAAFNCSTCVCTVAQALTLRFVA